jgi:hypothetical protein
MPYLYPGRDGKFQVEPAVLSDQLRLILEKAQAFNVMATEARRDADQWEAEGRRTDLVAARRRLAGVYEEFRDLEVKRLWSSQGLAPPDGVVFNDLRVSPPTVG